jgi:hypothetical protein
MGFETIPFVAVGLRVAHPVQPMPAPLFAVAARGQQRIDQRLPGCLVEILFECMDHFWSGYHSPQVVDRASNKSAGIGAGNRGEAWDP